MSLQEVRQSDVGADSDRRMLQHENIRQHVTDGSTKNKTHLRLPDEKYQQSIFVDNPCSSIKMRSVKNLSSLEEVRGRKSQP